MPPGAGWSGPLVKIWNPEQDLRIDLKSRKCSGLNEFGSCCASMIPDPKLQSAITGLGSMAYYQETNSFCYQKVISIAKDLHCSAHQKQAVDLAMTWSRILPELERIRVRKLQASAVDERMRFPSSGQAPSAKPPPIIQCSLTEGRDYRWDWADEGLEWVDGGLEFRRRVGWKMTMIKSKETQRRRKSSEERYRDAVKRGVVKTHSERLDERAERLQRAAEAYRQRREQDVPHSVKFESRAQAALQTDSTMEMLRMVAEAARIKEEARLKDQLAQRLQAEMEQREVNRVLQDQLHRAQENARKEEEARRAQEVLRTAREHARQDFVVNSMQQRLQQAKEEMSKTLGNIAKAQQETIRAQTEARKAQEAARAAEAKARKAAEQLQASERMRAQQQNVQNSIIAWKTYETRWELFQANITTFQKEGTVSQNTPWPSHSGKADDVNDESVRLFYFQTKLRFCKDLKEATSAIRSEMCRWHSDKVGRWYGSSRNLEVERLFHIASTALQWLKDKATTADNRNGFKRWTDGSHPG